MMTMEYTLVVSSCPCRCLYRLLAYIDMYYSTENSSSSSPSLSILGGWRRNTPVTEYVCTKSKVRSNPSQVTSEVVCSEHAAEPRIECVSETGWLRADDGHFSQERHDT